MTTNRIKLFAIMLFASVLLTSATFRPAPAAAMAPTTDDPAATFKAKCAPCHTPKADKFFDVTKSDDDHVLAIMKGKKGDKLPFMPGFEAKGMTEEEAKSLAAYMRTLRAPAN